MSNSAGGLIVPSLQSCTDAGLFRCQPFSTIVLVHTVLLEYMTLSFYSTTAASAPAVQYRCRHLIRTGMLGQSMASLIVAGRAANNAVARRFQIKQQRLQNNPTNFFIQTNQGMKTMARVMMKTTAPSTTTTQMAMRSVASTSTWMPSWAWCGSSRQGVAATPINNSVRAISTTANSASQQQYPHVKNTFVVETDQGRTFRLIDTSKFPRVKPGMVRKRLANQKTYVGTSKNIRHSPWRMNLVCQMIAGLPVPEALKQLEFSDKTKAPPVVQAVLQKTVNRADIRDGLQPTQLEVAECFATRGTPLKRIKPMARGRCVFIALYYRLTFIRFCHCLWMDLGPFVPGSHL